MENPDLRKSDPDNTGVECINAEIRDKIADAQRVWITSHIRPDGDAIGSMLGLGLAIQRAGKTVRMILVNGFPASFRYLEGSSLIERGIYSEHIQPDDLVIVVDSSDLHRIGGVFGDRIPDINIDHHITNPEFAKVNLILPEQAATSAIIACYIEEWGLSIDQAIASALLTGIVTDTIGYRTSNMTPGILRLSAQLMEYGADLPNLYTQALISKSYEAARYWGQGLHKLQRVSIPEGGVYVWTKLTLADRAVAGYTENDDADLVNFLSAVDSDLAVLINEQKNEHVKISWRARPGIDVSQIALKFGGGGHASAAGADIPGSLESVQEQVLDATYKTLVSYYSKSTGPGNLQTG